MDLQETFKDGMKAGLVSGLSLTGAIFLIYLGLVLLSVFSGESVNFMRMAAFAALMLFAALIVSVVGGIFSLLYAKMEERLERHDLGFALILTALIMIPVLRSGIQFLILFIPASIYIYYLEKKV